MTFLVHLHNAVFSRVEAAAPAVMPTLARLIFAATLLMYYINSGLLKFGDGIAGLFSPSLSAYASIFPKAFEAAGYDVSQMSTFHWAVALAGTWAEIILPVLIVIGLFTRIAALGMVVFVVVQSFVDIYGHGIAASDIGSWFDGLPTGLIVDQRAFWVFLLLFLVFRGAGPLSADRLLSARRAEAVPA